MRSSRYARSIRTRRARYAFRSTGSCACHTCRAEAARKRNRPADYEPDYDGPTRADTAWTGRG